MTATKTRSVRGPAGTVTRHWPTPAIITSIELTGITGDGLDRIGADGPPLEILPPGDVLDDIEELAAEFRASFTALSEVPMPAVEVGDVDLQIQVWRHGYDVPAAGHPAALIGWCLLAAGGTPGHAESGSLAISDPRAGSEMTAMPGLPWGRQIMTPPTPGAHLVIPGWLTHAVVPLERGQYVVAAFASSKPAR
ncbi:hypothetical protein [Actinomadura sp. SCN-SB]|uniref:hypothetical protein n=1 Tax=Actinomadura sp. SCN-SB TaxID=3373092 RepID=UPI0037504C74